MVCGGVAASSSALATGTTLVIEATDQMRPMATTMAIAMKERMCIPCLREIGRLPIVSHTFSLPACETGHNLMEIFATPSLPEDAADHDAIVQHAEIVLV
jgi:hypothetical protein